jgi:hypothetical protein
MDLLITKRFLEDLTALPPSLQHKCTQLIKEIQALELRDLRTRPIPGWRVHTLQDSPFLSFSPTMNYRVYAQLKPGNRMVLHWVKKHDKADKPEVTRNAGSDELAAISDEPLEFDAVYHALLALGLDEKRSGIFKACQTEDDFLEAVATAPPDVADVAWSILGLRHLEVPRVTLTRLTTPSRSRCKRTRRRGRCSCTRAKSILQPSR